MKNKLLLLLMIPVVYGLSACNDPEKANFYNQETRVDQMGLDFINNAIDGGRTEVELSTLAARISQNPKVVDFAKMMVQDHTAATIELKKIRDKELVNPTEGISEEHRQLVDSLAKLTGTDFDKAYSRQMTADHQEAVDLFEVGSEVRTPAIQSFARKTLPTIEKHLEAAKALENSLK
jgi:putative membrane protein